MKRPGRLSWSSAKRTRDLARRRAVRAAVFKRDGYACHLSTIGDVNWGGRHWGPCFGGLTVHHIRKASQGGLYEEENLMTMCRGHNDMVEDWPEAARAFGLVRYSWEKHDEDREHLSDHRGRRGPGHVE